MSIMSTWAARLHASCPPSPVEVPRKPSVLPSKLDINAETDVALLSLPPGCLQAISSFLTYGDIEQLGHVHTTLNKVLVMDDVIWEDQLDRFRGEMRNMYGHHLLRTDFASEDYPTSPAPRLFDQFKREHCLYDFDVIRSWNLDELTTLRNDTHGMCTLPLYQEPALTKDTKSYLHFLQEMGGTADFLTSFDGTGPQPVGAPPTAEQLTTEMKKMTVRILHPHREPSSSAQSNPLPNMRDEAEVMAYVMALSLAETQGGTPRPPHPFQRAHLKVTQPMYSPAELMTMMTDEIPDGADAHSYEGRFGVVDRTEEEDQSFLTSLSLTLSGAKRRRLHLKNHHHAVRNNGQTSRRRLGNVAAGQQAHQNPSDLALPPENLMLSSFHGTLLEVSWKELDQLSAKRLEDKWRAAIRTFVFGKNEERKGETPSTVGRPYPKEWVRYFLLPELFKEHCLGVLIVDPLRALLLVQEEKDEDEEAQEPRRHEPDRIVARRPITYGAGYNANPPPATNPF